MRWYVRSIKQVADHMDTDPKAEQLPEVVPEAQAAPEPLKPEPEIPLYVQMAMSRATSVMDPVEWAQQMVLANAMIKAKAVPKGYENPEQVRMGIQTGLEMSMGPAESIRSLYPVNGVFNLWGSAVGKQLAKHGWHVESYTDTPTSSKVTVKQIKGKRTYTEILDMTDAQKSGYVTDSKGQPKVGWREGTNRVLKLRYGALSKLIKSYIPEVLGAAGGIKEVEEDFVEVVDKPKNDSLNVPNLEAKDTAKKALEQRNSAS